MSLEDNLKLRSLIDESSIDPVNSEWLRQELFAITMLGIESRYLDAYFANQTIDSSSQSSVLHVLGVSAAPTTAPKGLTITKGRVSLADIDFDAQDSRRHEIKDYLTRKFRHVASISTFTYFKDKGVIRDASRALAVPLKDVNAVLKSVDTYEEFINSPDTQEFRKSYPDVVKIANALRGRIRGSGMHAAGIIVSKEPINKYAPIETRKDPNDDVSGRIPVVAYDMEEAENVGLIKIDLLGLKTLSVVQDSILEIEKRHGVTIDPFAIKQDDPAVYKDLSNGFTRGVFQLEAAPYTNLVMRMGVETFEHLVASNALVRPGAMNTIGKDYIDRKQGKAQVPQVHEIYDRITRDTFGSVLYQEQVMLLCNELAGMSWSDADSLRKIIGKKKDVHEFDQYKAKFIEGASKNIDAALAEKLWHDFEAHSAYSFNASHSVAYSMLSYLTAWIKHYYPLEFMLAVLKNEKDKETRTDYLIEAERLGIKVLMPHVNSSSVGFTIDGDAIRFGLSDVKYLSEKLAPRVLNLGPFESYADLRSKTLKKGTGINSRAIESLNLIGAAEFPDNPLTGFEKDHYYEYLNIPQFSLLGTDDTTTMVLKNLQNVDEFDEKENFIFYAMVKSIKRGKGWSRVEIVDKTGSVGVFHTEHTQIMAGKMYLLLVGNNRIFRYIDLEDVKELDNDPFIRYCRSDELKIPHDKKVVVAFSTRMTRANKHMGTVILSDKEKKLYTASVWPKNYGRALGKLQPGMVVDVSLRQMDDGTLFVQKIN